MLLVVTGIDDVTGCDWTHEGIDDVTGCDWN